MVTIDQAILDMVRRFRIFPGETADPSSSYYTTAAKHGPFTWDADKGHWLSADGEQFVGKGKNPRTGEEVVSCGPNG